MLLQIAQSEFYSQIDTITKVLIDSVDGFNMFFTITRVLWGIFYAMLLGYVIFQSFSQKSPINFMILVKPIVFLMLFEVAYAPGARIVDDLAKTMGDEISSDKVVRMLFNKSKIDINDYYEKVTEKAKEDWYLLSFTGLKKGVFTQIQTLINDEPNWDQFTPEEKTEILFARFSTGPHARNFDSPMGYSSMLEGTGMTFWEYMTKSNKTLFTKYMRELEQQAKDYCSSTDLFVLEGNTNSTLVNKVIIPFFNFLNQISYRLMYEIRALYLTILKFMGFFALAFSVFYATSDSWKKFLHTYICVTLWIVPLKIAELMMLFIKLDTALLVNSDLSEPLQSTVNSGMDWKAGIIISIAQVILIFLTPTIVSGIIGNATLQATVNNAASRLEGSGKDIAGKITSGNRTVLRRIFG